MAAVAARRLALLGTGIFGAYTVSVSAQQTPKSNTESAARSRFQYVGYDPKSDTAIVQFVGSKTASLLPAEDLMQMGLRGTPHAVCSALRSQGTLVLQPPRPPPFPLIRTCSWSEADAIDGGHAFQQRKATSSNCRFLPHSPAVACR